MSALSPYQLEYYARRAAADAALADYGNGVEIAVDDEAVLLAAADPDRALVLISNMGDGSAKVGKTGVTATTGIVSLASGAVVELAGATAQAALYAVREAATDTTLLVATAARGSA